MSIRQRGKKQVKTVRELREADPRRVSIVENGANQTPFRQVKSATGNEAVTDKETEMAKSKAKKSGAELVRVTFSKEQFKTEDAVKSWMTEKGYKESTITEEDKDFVVTSPEFDASKTAELKVIEAEAGVQYALLETKGDDTVSKAAEGEDEVVDDAPELDDEDGDEGGEDEAAKAAKKAEFDDITKELTEKVNSMRVYYSDKEKMKDVLKEADDGMPIGIGELYGLFTKALENAASRGDTEGVKAVSSEFGQMFTDLMTVTNKFIADATDTAAAAKTAEEVAAEATAKQVSDEAAKKAAEEEKTAILKGVEKSLEENVAKAMKSIQETVDTAMKGLEEQLKAITERVQGLENMEQTRKGADDVPDAQTTKKDNLSVLQKNIWGLR